MKDGDFEIFGGGGCGGAVDGADAGEGRCLGACPEAPLLPLPPRCFSFFLAGPVVEPDAGEIGREDGRWICEVSPATLPLPPPPLLPPPGTDHSCELLFVEAEENQGERVSHMEKNEEHRRCQNFRWFPSAYLTEPSSEPARRSFRRRPSIRWGSSDWSPLSAASAAGLHGGDGCGSLRRRRRCCYCYGDGRRRRWAGAARAVARCSATAAAPAGTAARTRRAPRRRPRRRRRGSRRRCRRRRPGRRRRRRR
jgi:hypothetical protein